MKQFFRKHEVRYMLHRRTEKKFHRQAVMKTFKIKLQGGYVELQVEGTFTAQAAADFRENFMFPPTAIDAGAEVADVVELQWHSSLL